MKALILAAGKGTRLKPLTNKKPKILLNFGNSNILEYLLSCLKENNINEIYVVTGYKSTQIKKKFKKEVNLILNKKYRTTNSIYSLFLAKKKLNNSNFFLINGDILISKKYFKLNNKNKKNSFTFGIKKKKVNLGEMNLVIKKNIVQDISKNISSKISNTESAQISYFSKKDSRLLFNSVDKLINSNQKNLFPASAYGDIIKKSCLKIKYVSKNHWFELDNITDYKKIKKALNNKLKISKFKNL